MDVIAIYYHHGQTTEGPKTTTDAKYDFNSSVVVWNSGKSSVITYFTGKFDPIRNNIDEMVTNQSNVVSDLYVTMKHLCDLSLKHKAVLKD